MPTAIEVRRKAFHALVENYENDLSGDGVETPKKHSVSFIKRVMAAGCMEAVTQTDPRLTSTSPGAIAVSIAKQVMSNPKASRAFIDIEIAEGLEGAPSYLVTFDKSAKNGDEIMPLISTQGDAAVICKPGDKIGEGIQCDLLMIAVDPSEPMMEAALAPYRESLEERKKRKKKKYPMTGVTRTCGRCGLPYVLANGVGKHCNHDGSEHTDADVDHAPSEGDPGAAATAQGAGVSESVLNEVSLHKLVGKTLDAHGMGGSKLFATPGAGYSALHSALAQHGLMLHDPVNDHGGEVGYSNTFGLRKTTGEEVPGTRLHVIRSGGVGDREGATGSDMPMKGRHEFITYLTGKKLSEATLAQDAADKVGEQDGVVLHKRSIGGKEDHFVASIKGTDTHIGGYIRGHFYHSGYGSDKEKQAAIDLVKKHVTGGKPVSHEMAGVAEAKGFHVRHQWTNDGPERGGKNGTDSAEYRAAMAAGKEHGGTYTWAPAEPHPALPNSAKHQIVITHTFPSAEKADAFSKALKPPKPVKEGEVAEGFDGSPEDFDKDMKSGARANLRIMKMNADAEPDPIKKKAAHAKIKDLEDKWKVNKPGRPLLKTNEEAETVPTIAEDVLAVFTYAYGTKAAELFSKLNESGQQAATLKMLKSFGVRPALKVEHDPFTRVFTKAFSKGKPSTGALMESADKFTEFVDEIAYELNGDHVAEAAISTVFDNGITTVTLPAIKAMVEKSLDNRAALLTGTARVLLLREGIVPAHLVNSFERLVAHIKASVSV